LRLDDEGLCEMDMETDYKNIQIYLNRIVILYLLHFLKKYVMWYLHRPSRIKSYIKRNEINVERIRNKEKITVVFFASNISMWHYQHLFDEMKKESRYIPYIVLTPLKSNSTEQKIEAIQKLREHFDKMGIKYLDYDTDNMIGYNIKRLHPDLLFYCQPYMTAVPKEHAFYRFKDSLLCYYPYFYHMARQSNYYNEDFHNRAWRLYYESDVQKRDAKQYASIGDYNVRVVGYPNTDDYLQKDHKDVWKTQDKRKKRIIWAPHFTINNDGWGGNTEFLHLADFMKEIAQKYKDSCQFAFKPHPKLKGELYCHKNWGKEKTDQYYSFWEKSDNCQLESGEFVDLFMSSDALIHDSGSFSIEYLYTCNPILYTCSDFKAYQEKMNMNSVAEKAFEAHYIGKYKEDIIPFIDNTVLGTDDPLKEKRIKFRKDFLIPSNGKTVAQNTIEDLNKSLQPEI